jgi:hypothetical protein
MPATACKQSLVVIARVTSATLSKNHMHVKAAIRQSIRFLKHARIRGDVARRDDHHARGAPCGVTCAASA